MQQDLNRLLDVAGVPFAVVANLETTEIRTVGDARAIATNDLFSFEPFVAGSAFATNVESGQGLLCRL